MKRSTERMLTTHVGSLPRPQEVVDFLFAQDRGDAYDSAAFDATMRRAVSDAVATQVAAGVDVVSDGEMSKISYATYIRHRLTGFEIGEMPRATPRDLDDFPSFKDRLARLGATPTYHRPICRGPVAVRDLHRCTRISSTCNAAAREHGALEAFMNAASPGVIAVFQPNEYYPSHEAYFFALADAMRSEYETIVAAGLLLQIDSPDLAMGRHITLPRRRRGDVSGQRRAAGRGTEPCLAQGTCRPGTHACLLGQLRRAASSRYSARNDRRHGAQSQAAGAADRRRQSAPRA